jgi:predicted nucleic acid-binding protein
MSASLDFFDSNVLLYAIDADAAAEKRRISRDLIGQALTQQSAVISWQVVQETLNVATHKFKASISAADRKDLLHNVLQPLWKVQPDTALHTRAIDLQQRLGFAFHDSLIVAAALQAGCKRLLSEDLQDGQRIGSLRVENPFRP